MYTRVWVIAALIFIVAATTGAKTDREREGLLGKVKKVTSESGTWEKGATILVQTVIYDQRGNIAETEITKYRMGGAPSNEKLRTISERSPDGRISGSTSYAGDGSLQSRTRYRYDVKGNRIEDTHYNKEGEMQFKFVMAYDVEGNMVEMKSYLRDGSLRSKSVYTYDHKGHLTGKSSFKDCHPSGECKTLDYKVANTYDSMGHLSESLIYKANGSLDQKTVYRYDGAGNPVEETTYTADGSVRKKETAVYKYDQGGNWIEKTTHVVTQDAAQPEPAHKIRRTITYYGSRIRGRSRFSIRCPVRVSMRITQ
jgi:YD repeat-containing protein